MDDIKCKDCRWYEADGTITSAWCKLLKIPVPPYFYCADAWEKRETEDAE